MLSEEPEEFRPTWSGRIDDEIVRRHESLVYRVIRDQGIKPHNEDDLYQHIWLKVGKSATTDNVPPDRFTPWLIRIAVNACRDLHRSGRRTVPLTCLHTERLATSEGSDDERRELVLAALDELDDERRRLIDGRYFEGRTRADLVRESGQSLHAVRIGERSALATILRRVVDFEAQG